MTEPPGPDWCYYHERDEPVPEDGCVFRICGECFHLFRTAEDLMQQHSLELAKLKLERRTAPSVEAIYACPFCAHDF